MDKNYFPLTRKIACDGVGTTDSRFPTFIELELEKVGERNYIIFVNCNYRTEESKEKTSCRKVGCKGECRYDIGSSF
jgi:hypothetical protein